VIIHSRDCDDEMLMALRDEYRRGPLRGVMHSFCGSAEMARECVAMGLYISFSGMLTYKKNDLLRSSAAGIPLDRLLVETDAPYLSPEPMRATRPNVPALVVHTGDVLAKVHQLSTTRMAEITTQNALRLFSRMR
jgi:TatD DNase family protein